MPNCYPQTDGNPRKSVDIEKGGGVQGTHKLHLLYTLPDDNTRQTENQLIYKNYSN